VNLDDALRDFDAAETTLRRLETVWQRMSELIPKGISFMGRSPEGIQYEDLRRAFRELAAGLPMLDGWVVTAEPLELDDIAQNRLDAREVGFIDAPVSTERGIAAPGVEIREYRHRFNRARRAVVRGRLLELIGAIEHSLAELAQRIEPTREEIEDPEWSTLVAALREVDRLMGSAGPRKGRWRDLARHLAWAQGVDLHDVAKHDWPSVLADVQATLYDEFEPIPVQVDDLAALVAARPRGPVSTALAWDVLDAEAFERLIFNIISDAAGYENPNWLMHPNAPDRGRDLSVTRVATDVLSGVHRHRVIIQCKNWRTKSVAARDVSEVAVAVTLWDSPPVDVLVIATSGRFTRDAVDWIEKHNHDRNHPTIEPWPESHLESLLAQRPHLVEEFGLRRGSV